jgi:putative transcriptional regulator
MIKAQEIPKAGTSGMLKVRLDELLEERGRSAYWLAKETNLTQVALWRLKHGKTGAIKFETLEAICNALECTPGDLLVIVKSEPKAKRKG